MMSDHRPVGPLLVSTAVSVAGDGAFLTAAPLLATAITRDPLTVSLVTAVGFLPWLLVGLPAGALVDRANRQITMIVADVCRATLLGALALAVAIGRASLVLLFLTILMVGAAQTFFDAAAQALIPALVGREKSTLAQVNGLIWVADASGRSLVGPPLGSLTFAVSPMLPFALDSISFLMSALFIRRLPSTSARPGPHERVDVAIRAGFGQLIKDRELRVLAFSMTMYNFGYSMAAATLVLLLTIKFEVPAAFYGVLLGTAALGGVAAGLLAGHIFRRTSYRQAMTLAMLGQAVGWICVALVKSPWAAGALLALVGACGSIASVVVSAARHERTPNEILGRIVGTFRFVGFSASGVGALIGGVIADRWGLAAPPMVAGILLVVASVIMRPRVRRRRSTGSDPRISLPIHRSVDDELRKERMRLAEPHPQREVASSL